MDEDRDPTRSLGVLVGVGLAVLGGWLLLRSTGFLPPWIEQMWVRASWPIAIIVLGIAIVIASQRGGLSIRGPLPGSRLYKSRSERWVEGVLGGLGSYMGIDPVVLRLAFIVLVLAGWGWLVLAYIVLAVVVPREPASTDPPPAT